MGTGQAGEASENRPMTAVRAAGYSAAAGKGGAFDPANLGQAGRGPAPPLQKRAENRLGIGLGLGLGLGLVS